MMGEQLPFSLYFRAVEGPNPLRSNAVGTASISIWTNGKSTLRTPVALIVCDLEFDQDS